jgi:hypothetical protein
MMVYEVAEIDQLVKELSEFRTYQISGGQAVRNEQFLNRVNLALNQLRQIVAVVTNR